MGPVGGIRFEMHQQHDADGAVRLSLIGELDLAASQGLQLRLRELKTERAAVRLDLSRLEFVDSTGLRTLIKGAEDAQRDGWQLEVERNVTPQVGRVIELVGASAYLWPSSDAVASEARPPNETET
jgi:anti-sigma B factor antagonist